MLGYRIITVIALALLGLGIYSTFDSETHLAERASANLPRKRVLAEAAKSKPSIDSLRLNWLESDTLRTDTTFADAKGAKHTLRITHYWTRDTLLRAADAPKRVTFYLDGDTLHFLSYAHITAAVNGQTTVNHTLTRNSYQGTMDETYLSVYMLLHTRFVGWSEVGQQYVFAQSLGLPSGVSWTRTWFTLSRAGALTGSGNAGTCEGGVQLDARGSLLLTCQSLKDFASGKVTELGVFQPAIVKWLNDTLYLVVEDMPEGVEPNAQLRHRNGQVLLSFIYHGYERTDYYRSGTAQLGDVVYLINPHVDELIILPLHEIDKHKVLSLRKLKQYHTHQEAKSQLCFAFREFKHCCVYLDAKGTPNGVTLVYMEQPS